MNLNRAKTFAIATSGALLLLPGAASAANLKGDTSQPGKKVIVKTGDDTEVDYAKITWNAGCRYGGEVNGKSTFMTPFDRASANGFRTAGKDELKDGRYDVSLRVTIEGERKKFGYKGTFKASARYEKNGKYVTTCKSGKVRWIASS